MKLKLPSVSLGELQNELENASRNFKAATAKLISAQNSYVAAEDRYHAAQKALMGGVHTVGQQNKIV